MRKRTGDSLLLEGRRVPRRRRRSRRWNAIRTMTAVTIGAPREKLVKLYLDYQHWSTLFPTIRGARLVKEDTDRIVLDIDHKTEGHVVNVLRHVSPYEIELDERQPQFSAEFINRFEPDGDATRLVVTANVRLKGPYAILAPFLGAYIRHRIRRFVLEPMRAAIETPVVKASA